MDLGALRGMSPRLAMVLVAACLGGLALFLHGDALHGFWRWDDGGHLRFTVQHAPWEYFFIPEVTRAQSGANVTPWNPFFYDLNLAMFGWQPAWHYAHQLAILWASALATWFLLAPRLGRAAALLGSALFLIGLPTHQVAHQLMTGHYATGLLFMILALLCHARGLDGGDKRLHWLGAGFYLLATTCKEVFVPLPAVLFFLPLATWGKRLRALLPYALVAAAYLVWRHAVLGRLVGGYPGAQPSVAEIAGQFAGIPALLFGQGLWGQAALVALGMLVVLAAFRRGLPAGMVAVSGVLLAGPLLALVAYPGIHAPDRYLFLPWWAMSVLIAVLAAGGPGRVARWLLALFVLAAVLVAGQRARPAFDEAARLQDRLYAHALEMPASATLLPPESRSYMKYQLDAVMQAYDIDHGARRPRPMIVATLQDACDPRASARVEEYEPACDCFRDVSGRFPDLAKRQLADLEARLSGVALRPMPLSMRLEFSGGLIRWWLGPHPGGTYEFVNGITGERIAAVAPQGFYPWAAGERFRLFMRYTAPEGWSAITPIFDFDPGSGESIKWQGNGLAAWPEELFQPLRQCAARRVAPNP
jgi:hypothetical protein